LIFSTISAPESSWRKCRPVTSSGPSAWGISSLNRVANVLWSKASSSRPQSGISILRAHAQATRIAGARVRSHPAESSAARSM
jgi:hypothetical protein